MFEHWLNTDAFNTVIPVPLKSIVVNPVQPANASVPIVVTDDGTVNDVIV